MSQAGSQDGMLPILICGWTVKRIGRGIQI
jgi:hypothetical protein